MCSQIHEGFPRAEKDNEYPPKETTFVIVQPESSYWYHFNRVGPATMPPC